MTTRWIHSIIHPSAMAWELLQQLKTTSTNKVLVPNLALCYQLRDDLSVLAPELKVFICPPKENNLLKTRGPSLQRRIERINYFSAYFNHQKLLLKPEQNLFLAPITGLIEKNPVKSFWTENSLLLKKGLSQNKEKLCSDLLDLGYEKVELVESPFEFAERGSIVDLFPPQEANPLRIELFGDELQSIRSFHPDSQRKIAELDQTLVPPSREYLIHWTKDSQVFQKTRSALRPHLDTLEWDKKSREEFFSRLEQHSSFPLLDFWAPLLTPDSFETKAPSFNDFNILIDPHQTQNEIKQFYIDTERNFLSAQTEGEWLPSAHTYYQQQPFLETAFKKALAQEKIWLTTKANTGLVEEPEASYKSHVSGIEDIRQKLTQARLNQEALPFELFSQKLKQLQKEKIQVVILANTLSQLERLQFLLANYHLSLKICKTFSEVLQDSKSAFLGLRGLITQGFLDKAAKKIFILDEDIFGVKKRRSHHQRKRTRAHKDFNREIGITDLKENDYIVHKQHGIGRYLGLKTMDFQGIPSDFFELVYKDGKIFLPVTHLSQIHKYQSAQSTVSMDKLGGSTWTQKKKKVQQELQSLAAELLSIYSKRELAIAPKIEISEQEESLFANSFPFDETNDQLEAIKASTVDLKGPRPMDRLVCGDVGYGKTEVALRAAYTAAKAGHQCAVLVPTTLLCAQHEKNFHRRLSPFGIKSAAVSRLKTSKENKETLEKLKEGKLSIIVGTHRLLGKDVQFKKLGLVIVDEEQRFGVAHKEKLKKLRNNVHILSLTATPIPRTLNMAMSGIKDLSIITTPPQDRLSVRTYVAKKKDDLIKEAVTQEIKRGGQVFYLHNRVQSIQKCYEELKELLPNISIQYVHGQMLESQLEERMLQFYQGKTQLLISTTIIESGLDVPNANTLIVERADTFGLSQLYQIRGRVGRSTKRAYAYFLLPKSTRVNALAEERLKVLESYQELGSGFSIASHDMDMRGSGDFLGKKQSGNINTLGFDAYMELLQQCVSEIKGENIEEEIDPDVQLGINTTIPAEYIPDLPLKLLFYRRLASAPTEQSIENIAEEMDDRFGSFPKSVHNLIAAMRIKCQLRRLAIKSLSAGKHGFSIFFDQSTPVNTQTLVEKIARYPKHFQVQPNGKLLIKKPFSEKQEDSDLLKGVEGALSQLESWC